MNRREFGKKVISYSVAGTAAGLSLLKWLYADDRIENGLTPRSSYEDPRIVKEKIIEDFNKIYEEVKARSGTFAEPIDINGDRTLDTVEFDLRDTGSVSIKQDSTGGRWLGVGFLIAGKYLGKVYAVFEGGKIKYYKDGQPLCKRQFVTEKDVEKFFGFMLKHYEK